MKLQLLHRIVSRHPADRLIEELGAAEARQCQAASKRQVMRGLSVLDAERRCTELAEREGIDLVLLKFAALQHYGAVSASSRAVSDLDLLLDGETIPAFAEALIGIGATRVTYVVPAHHPAVLKMPSGRSVELHVCLEFVRAIENHDSATLGHLRQADLLQGLGGTSHVFLPKKEPLLAHLVAHALVQHAFAPKAYPMTRLLGDAIDLGVAENPDLVRAAQRLIADSAASQQTAALASLAAACATGEAANVLTSASDASSLLRHMLAATMDERYYRRLRIRRVGQLVKNVGVVATFQHWCRSLLR